MEIEPATIEDLNEVIGWIGSPEEAKSWGGPRVRYPLAVIALQTDIHFNQAFSMAAHDQGRLVGFGQVIEVSATAAHLARIIVNPRLRRRGFGRRLMEGLLTFSRQQGFRRITLNVYRNNVPALTLYRALGFGVIFEDEENDSLHLALPADHA